MYGLFIFIVYSSLLANAYHTMAILYLVKERLLHSSPSSLFVAPVKLIPNHACHIITQHQDDAADVFQPGKKK
jgi:uncharacterized membrane protein